MPLTLPQRCFPLGLFSGQATPRLYNCVVETLRVYHFARRAAIEAGITKRVTTHAFRHSLATHLLKDGYDIPPVKELPGHNDVKTTMIYKHVLNRGARGVRSPLEGLRWFAPNRKETAYGKL